MRIGAADLQVLGRDAVADGTGFFHAAGADQGAASIEGCGNDLAPGHARQQAADGRLHRVDIRRVGAQQNALCQLIVLGLAEQVHGHPVRRGAAVGKHQNFTRAGNHVDADFAKHPALGSGHIGVTRAGYFVHRRNGRRAIGQRRHGLRAANGEDPVHTRHMGCSQHQGVALALPRFHAGANGRGHDHGDLSDASHLRRYRVHQHTGRVGRFAAGHVNAHAVQRRDLLAEQAAVAVAVTPALAAGDFLGFVVAAHALRSSLQRRALRCREAFKSGA